MSTFTLKASIMYDLRMLSFSSKIILYQGPYPVMKWTLSLLIYF